MSYVVALVAGFIFGLGLALAGMTHPQVVLGFLDVAGAWNPSLLLVLGGAVGVTAVGFYALRRLRKPVFAAAFATTDTAKIDRPLIVGSMLFGIGWGISGYCPGPAIALLAAPDQEAWIFLPALLLGYALHSVIKNATSPNAALAHPPSE
jgi:uncharacterized membrane protein YedE/YeeE